MNQYRITYYSRNGVNELFINDNEIVKELDEAERFWLEDAIQAYEVAVLTCQGNGRWVTLAGGEADAWLEAKGLM